MVLLQCDVLPFVLFVLGHEDVEIPRDTGAHVIDSAEVISEDDKVLLDCLEHVSRVEV
jgi:hypothetical protein